MVVEYAHIDKFLSSLGVVCTVVVLISTVIRKWKKELEADRERLYTTLSQEKKDLYGELRAERTKLYNEMKEDREILKAGFDKIDDLKDSLNQIKIEFAEHRAKQYSEKDIRVLCKDEAGKHINEHLIYYHKGNS